MKDRGKSTLALHICHQWAQGASWLERFDIVILAYLRDEAIQNASTLADILPADRKYESIVPRIQDSYGEGVLFIFDGWDEFPPNLMNNSFASIIIQNPERFFLQRSTVLITSRPATGKQGLKYGTVSLTVSLRDGTSENSVFQWIFRHN